MRLLLDQMLDEDVATALRADAYDVLRVSAFRMQEADDAEILRKTIGLDRILVTLDEHFGDWTILPLSHHPGVVRLKVSPTSTAVILEVLAPFLAKHVDTTFTDHLVIVKRHHVRWIKTSS